MKLVIDIPERILEEILKKGLSDGMDAQLYWALYNGTVLKTKSAKSFVSLRPCDDCEDYYIKDIYNCFGELTGNKECLCIPQNRHKVVDFSHENDIQRYFFSRCPRIEEKEDAE